MLMNVPQKGRRRLAPAALGGVLVAMILTAWAGTAGAAPRLAFNTPGNVLIADQFNNRVIELSRAGNVVWHFGTGSFVAGPHSVVAPNDAQRVPGNRTLIAGTGAPAGAPGYPAGGAVDSRVLLVNQAGKIVWTYGKAGVNGTGFNRLNTPVQATWLPNHDVLITDQGNDRVIMVTPAHKIVFQYGQTGVAGSGPDQLNTPNSAELLANGHILIADEGGNRVIEVTKAKKIVWSDATGLNAPAFASRLPSGRTLITDGGNNRVVEVNSAGTVTWSYTTNAQPGSNANPAPSQAVRLRNGDTLIADQFNDRVMQVTRAKNIRWSYGALNAPGKVAGLLNAPYSAKVIGDFTGLTPPK
jgi:hypothetical protein